MTSSPLSWPPGPALMRADAVYKDASARGASLILLHSYPQLLLRDQRPLDGQGSAANQQ